MASIRKFNQKIFNKMFGKGSKISDSVNVQDQNGTTGLIWAITNDCPEYALRMLNDDNLNVNILDKNNKSALDYTYDKVKKMSHLKKYVDIAVKIVKHKTFDTNTTCYISYELDEYETIKYKQEGTDANIIFKILGNSLDRSDYVPVFLALCDRHDVKINSKYRTYDGEYQTPIAYVLTSAFYNFNTAHKITSKILSIENVIIDNNILKYLGIDISIKILDLLLKLPNIDVNVIVGESSPILFWLIDNNSIVYQSNNDDTNNEINKNIAKIIIDNPNFNPNAKNENDKTYLYEASNNNRNDIVEMLLKNKNINIDN